MDILIVAVSSLAYFMALWFGNKIIISYFAGKAHAYSEFAVIILSKLKGDD